MGGQPGCDACEISQLINRYCHSMDYGRHEEWLDMFTADAVYDVLLPDRSLYARVEGTEQLRAFIAGFPRPGLHKHIYATPLIEVDGDSATVEVTFMMLSAEGTGVEVSAFGRSEDRLVRTAEGWRFSERRIVTEAMNVPAA